MDIEWQAVRDAARAAWPDEPGEPSLRWTGSGYQAVYPAPMGEVDATAATPEAALAALAARIGGDAYALKVAVRKAEVDRELAAAKAEVTRLTAEAKTWTERTR